MDEELSDFNYAQYDYNEGGITVNRLFWEAFQKVLAGAGSEQEISSVIHILVHETIHSVSPAWKELGEVVPLLVRPGGFNTAHIFEEGITEALTLAVLKDWGVKILPIRDGMHIRELETYLVDLLAGNPSVDNNRFREFWKAETLADRRSLANTLAEQKVRVIYQVASDSLNSRPKIEYLNGDEIWRLFYPYRSDLPSPPHLVGEFERLIKEAQGLTSETWPKWAQSNLRLALDEPRIISSTPKNTIKKPDGR